MDQLTAMRIFVKVIESGSFSAVAREQNNSQASISKKISALEEKLGVQLIKRSSRMQSLTDVGKEYFEHCKYILGEIDELDAKIGVFESSPKGVIRISAPVPFGRIILCPLISEFLQLYSEIHVDLSLGERNVDLIPELFDVAIRARELKDSSLVSTYLFESPLHLYASPKHTSKYGEPKSPGDLRLHPCVIYSQSNSLGSWNFSRDDHEEMVDVTGSFKSSSADAILAFVLSGEGIAQLPDWMVHQHVASGQLIQLLADYNSDSVPFHIVYPQSRYMPLRVRYFIDFLKDRLAN